MSDCLKGMILTNIDYMIKSMCAHLPTKELLDIYVNKINIHLKLQCSYKVCWSSGLHID